ncbi:MAG TPA: helicase C-terminal domain-containing protein [Clostridiales bacterium]|nr:helicase C-terminal domain-containing protein [Clostridiales bacterium]HOL91769.1 helicase C-terminal domain-containing protein [Clostridiales bacterium]
MPFKLTRPNNQDEPAKAGMQDKPTITVSVRELLEFAMQSGDLRTASYSPSRAAEGTRGHAEIRAIIKQMLSDDAIYETEVPITFRLEGDNLVLEITGRIDGLLKDAAGDTVHEIKTTMLPLEQIEHDHDPQHWAQVKCYAYMYARMHGLDRIAIMLTYYQLDEKQEKSFTDIYDIDSLESFFMPLAGDYMAWQEKMNNWAIVRDRSIHQLDFPYPERRKGQQELMDDVYDTIGVRGLLFAQAPTGTGKTVAVLFPSVKALGDRLVSKIFYLTAKTTTRSLAEKSLEDMRKKGLRIKSITITAKEKVCFNGTHFCNPEICMYKEDYYGKIKKALEDALQEDALDRTVIEKYASKYSICPFELTLDLSLLCDVIICDYNYLYDPRVKLSRYFSKRGNYCFLVDEAHNLVDRARDMYSAEISRRSYFRLKKQAKEELPEIYDALDRMHKCFLDISKALAEDSGDQKKGFYLVERAYPDELCRPIERFTGLVGDLLPRILAVSFMDQLLEVYFDSLHFLRISELYDERYVTCYDKSATDFKIKLFCVDPSKLLRDAMNKGRASILFSATLSPIGYFTSMLGGGDDARVTVIPSPFPRENLCVYIDDSISTKYKTRMFSYDRIAETILETVSARTGNYMAFFPSFEYLNEVYYRFMGISRGIRSLCQTPGMSEAARQEFLDEFEKTGETSLVGFAVMGGVFSEGIDLAGDRLSGAIIVGVGLPQICNERNIIRAHFDERSGNGFEYAYIYPGINRVLQAAGRVIRTEDDMGVVILLDERFSHYNYRELLPPEWTPIQKMSDGILLTDVLQDFWG